MLLAAPPVKVTDEEAEEFIKTFNETLESVDPETIAKAAAPAEGEEPAGVHQSPLADSMINLTSGAIKLYCRERFSLFQESDLDIMDSAG